MSAPRLLLFLFFFTTGLLLCTASMPAQLVRVSNTSLNLPAATPPDAAGPLVYTSTAAFPPGINFVRPMATAYPPGETNSLYVIEREGVIWKLSDIGTAFVSKSQFMNLASFLQGQNRPLVTDNENGLMAIAFHPNYQQNGYFYLYYSINVGNRLHQRLARFKANGSAGSYRSSGSAPANSEAPLLTLYDQAGNHNGGDLGFGSDGYLYISLGDEGGGNDSYNNARFITKNFWGQMLRLDVDSSPANRPPSVLAQPGSPSVPSAVHPGSYRVPTDNPFVGRTSWHGYTISTGIVKEEIYATGFRNPFRFNFDPPTGRLFLGDVGQDAREEVNIVTPGGDYGWSWREGDIPFTQSPKWPDNNSTNAEPATGFSPVAPIISYPRTSGTNRPLYGRSVCGGIVYRGNLLPELVGAYLAGDIYSGTIAAYRENSPGVWTGERLFSRQNIVHFGVNPKSGEPILCNLDDGILYRIIRGPMTAAPALLSQTGVFSHMGDLTPYPGIVPYRPNLSFWSDGATKTRFFAIKGLTSQMSYSAAGNWSFPTGMVWVKHFESPQNGFNRRLETRLLVKTETGVYGLTYKWRNDHSDADLVNADGLIETIPGSPLLQQWRYPSRSECLSCHTTAAGYALSFTTAQLNRQFTFTGSSSQNQIEAFRQAGYLTHFNEATARHLPVLTTSATQSLEWRVRSYLAVNCAPCHQPGGGAQGTWDARLSTPTALAQIINGSLVNQGNDPDDRVVVPGDVGHSMLLKRMQGMINGVARMPPIATRLRDEGGEALLASWIESLSDHQTLAQWLEAHFGLSPGPAGLPQADADGDGVANQDEYLLKTDPLNADRHLRSGTLVKVGSTLQLNFTQLANRMALVEVSSDLVNWTPAPGDGNGYLFPPADVDRIFSFNLNLKKRFFRIRWGQP